MGNRLKEVQKNFFGDHSDKEWSDINESVQSEFEKANKREKQEFIDSGAGNLLAQILDIWNNHQSAMTGDVFKEGNYVLRAMWI